MERCPTSNVGFMHGDSSEDEGRGGKPGLAGKEDRSAKMREYKFLGPWQPRAVLHVAPTTPAARVNLVHAVHFDPALRLGLRLVQRAQEGGESGANQVDGPP
jgi:hypothetical protein